VPLLPGNNNNYFNLLTVEEIPEISAVEKDTSNEKPEPPARLPKRPKWERQLPEKLEIDAAEPESNSLYLQIEIESMETERKQGTRALVDCG